MRLGIVILPDQPWATAARRWRLAEEYGFHHAWTYDHLGWRDLVDGPWFGAVPTLTAAATVTSRIRLGTLVASPNFRHPVSFVREVTAIDDISDGRFVLGVGAVGFRAASIATSRSMPRRRTRSRAEVPSRTAMGGRPNLVSPMSSCTGRDPAAGMPATKPFWTKSQMLRADTQSADGRATSPVQ